MRRMRRWIASRRDWATRLRTEQLRRIGLTPETYHTQLDAAYRVWRGGKPWRFLPERVASLAFVVFGRRFAARWLAARGA